MTIRRDIATDLNRELAEQRRWRPRPRYARSPAFERLVRNEFLSAEEQDDWQSRALARIVRFAAEHVPYYRDLLADRGLVPGDIASPADLAKLPVLDRVAIRTHEARLRPRALPRGEKVYGLFTTSGSTGHPARVVHTVSSNTAFSYLAQRAYRWYRFNPAKTMVVIRTAGDLPPRPGGGLYTDGITCRMPRWRYAGKFFETGPWFGLASSTPMERQLAWLRKIRPAYLVSPASWLEYLTYATEGQCPVDSLEGAMGIVEQVTAPMRERLERVLGVPVDQGYGLNEIGLVAARCPAGRYHVHTEHCLVEIVDPDGRPCPPGVAGRIAVTGLNNLAMPLFRYDTDDLAEVPTDPCPCGRTLPAFVNLIGRYRRYIALPAGTYDVYRKMRKAVADMPDDLARDMRQFQMHLYRDGRFELRVATVAPLPEAFYAQVRAAWEAAAAGRTETLVIVEVDEIARTGAKFQDFTSDYLPPLQDAEV